MYILDWSFIFLESGKNWQKYFKVIVANLLTKKVTNDILLGNKHKGDNIRMNNVKNNKKMKYIITIIISIILSLLCGKTYATIEQNISSDIENIDTEKYPGIKEKIEELKSEHPNWNFKILYTGIEWEEVIANEYIGHGASPRNLIPANKTNYSGDWICAICGPNKYYDSGKWSCASENALKYMLDPRNSMNSADIFQFQELTYSEDSNYSVETIKLILANTVFATDEFANAIYEASKNANVDPYYIAVRIRQEQGTDGSSLSSGKGYNGEYEGYYNFFNISASGNSSSEIILNGLSYAKEQGWDTIEKAIEGGAKFIAKKYIAAGQNTLYFQKFDVVNDEIYGMYWHQYMQNLLAAQNEGTTIRKLYESLEAVENNYTFIIPVYENMPETACERPETTSSDNISLTTDLVVVNVRESLRMRNEPNGENTVGWVYAGEIVTRLEKATEKIGGTYWDKVMKSNGTTGYCARETNESEESYKLYLQDITNSSGDLDVGLDIEIDIGLDVGLDIGLEDDVVDIITATEKGKYNEQENIITIVPSATVSDIANMFEGNIEVKKSDGTVLAFSDSVPTGAIVNDKYNVVKIGDVNEDGEINSGDLFYTQKYLLKKNEFNEYTQKACDVNNDSEINSGDLFYIQKYLLNKTEFSI